MGMSKTLSRLQGAQEERGQQEAQAVTCGRPCGRGTLRSGACSRVPCRLWVGAHQSSAEFRPVGPLPTPACSAGCSLSPGLHFPAHRPPAPPWPGLGGNCNKDLESLQAPAALTAVLIGLPPPIIPGAWGPRTLPPHSLGQQQVPLRAATPPPLWAAQPRRRGHARAHRSCERPGCLHGAAEPKGSQAHWEDVPEWRKAGLQEK